MKEISLTEAEMMATELIQLTIEDAINLMDVVETFEDVSEEDARGVLDLIRTAWVRVSW